MTKRLTLLALLLTACATDEEMTGTKAMVPLEPATAEELAALRARDRAPYSPPGWPLEVGDRIRFSREQALAEEFPGWQHSAAVFWVGDTPYGAYYTADRGDPLPGSTGLDLAFSPLVYLGHFPVKTPKHPSEWSDWEWQMVPPHLRSRALVQHLYQAGKGGASVGGTTSGCNLVAPTSPDCKAQADTLSAWRERLHEPWTRKYRGKKERS